MIIHKGHKDKQRSTKHAHTNKDRVTRIPLKPGGELRCPRKVKISCSTSCIPRVNLVTNPPPPRIIRAGINCLDRDILEDTAYLKPLHFREKCVQNNCKFY
jgi:hypothetical protein